MLISFSFANWMSFRDRTEFSMIANDNRKHSKRLSKIRGGIKLLPLASIYGGNASGKSNFCKALKYAKKLIVNGNKTENLTNTIPYRLKEDCLTAPTVFEFVLLVDTKIYEFSFSLNSSKIIEEKLIEHSNSGDEIVLYHRENSNMRFADHDAKFDAEHFKHIFKGTRDNRLFLTNSVDQKATYFKAIYDWFRDSLMVFEPDDKMGLEEYQKYFKSSTNIHMVYEELGRLLNQFDTGISNVALQEMKLKDSPLSDLIDESDLYALEENAAINMPNGWFLTRQKGDLVLKKAVTCHQGEDGTNVEFDIMQESDGSRRLFAILPTLFDLLPENLSKVYVIDEIDRSIHTLLTKELLKMYLDSCGSKSRSQLILSTHDVVLMDSKIFRCDEMWVTERNFDGSSTLYSFNEYKDIWKEKNIQKKYLDGRFGGIPRFFIQET